MEVECAGRSLTADRRRTRKANGTYNFCTVVFRIPVPQLCLTRRRRSFVRVVEDAGFVTRSSLSSFLVFLRLVLFQSQDARRTDTKRVTNGWRIGLLIPHGRERRRFFFRAVHYHSEVRSKSSEQWPTTEQGGWWCCVRF